MGKTIYSVSAYARVLEFSSDRAKVVQSLHKLVRCDEYSLHPDGYSADVLRSVLHTSREFSSRVSVSREYFRLEMSRSSRNVSLHSSCLVCPECGPRIKSCGRERARAAVVLDSDLDGLRFSRRKFLKGRTHSRAFGINRWYEQKTGDLSTTLMAMESWPCLEPSNYHNLWKSVFLKISRRIPRVSNILEMSRTFSTCLAHSQSRPGVPIVRSAASPTGPHKSGRTGPLMGKA
jgi:hypothetical protein